MKLNEAMGRVLQIFPNATCDEDNDGQIVIYTDMMAEGWPDEELVPFES